MVDDESSIPSWLITGNICTVVDEEEFHVSFSGKSCLAYSLMRQEFVARCPSLSWEERQIPGLWTGTYV